MCSVQELYNDMYSGALAIPDAVSDDGKQIISDTKLRAMIPANFVPMRDCHKQMCGCEVCIIMKRHQACLNAHRKRRWKQMTDAVESSPVGSPQKAQASEALDSYKAATQDEGGSHTFTRTLRTCSSVYSAATSMGTHFLIGTVSCVCAKTAQHIRFILRKPESALTLK